MGSVASTLRFASADGQERQERQIAHPGRNDSATTGCLPASERSLCNDTWCLACGVLSGVGTGGGAGAGGVTVVGLQSVRPRS
jgi:hypothetical protein